MDLLLNPGLLQPVLEVDLLSGDCADPVIQLAHHHYYLELHQVELALHSLLHMVLLLQILGDDVELLLDLPHPHHLVVELLLEILVLLVLLRIVPLDHLSGKVTSNQTYFATFSSGPAGRSVRA